MLDIRTFYDVIKQMKCGNWKRCHGYLVRSKNAASEDTRLRIHTVLSTALVYHHKCQAHFFLRFYIVTTYIYNILHLYTVRSTTLYVPTYFLFMFDVPLPLFNVILTYSGMACGYCVSMSPTVCVCACVFGNLFSAEFLFSLSLRLPIFFSSRSFYR